MPCCGSCAEGKSCESGGVGLNLFYTLGFAVPGLIVGDVANLPLSATLILGLASAMAISRKDFRELHQKGYYYMTPDALTLGGIAYWIARQNNVGVGVSLLAFMGGVYVWSQYTLPPQSQEKKNFNRIPTMAALGPQGDFGMGPNKDIFHGFKQGHSIKKKL